MSSPLSKFSWSHWLLVTLVAIVLHSTPSFAQPWESLAEIRAHNISKITKLVEQNGKRDTAYVIVNQLLPQGRVRQLKIVALDSVLSLYDSLNRLIELSGPKGIRVTWTYSYRERGTLLTRSFQTVRPGQTMIQQFVTRYDDAGSVIYDSTADSVYERLSDRRDRSKSMPRGRLASEGIRCLDLRGRDSFEVVHVLDTAHKDSLVKILQTTTTHSPDSHTSHRVITTQTPGGTVLATEIWDIDSTSRRATRTVKYGRRTLQGTVVWSLDKTAEQGEWLDTAWDRHFSVDKSRYIWDTSGPKGHTHTEWIYDYDLGRNP